MDKTDLGVKGHSLQAQPMDSLRFMGIEGDNTMVQIF